MKTNPAKFYITTPIYYVNDEPHIGHVYTTTIADIIARYHHLFGQDVFFLTGTDEHATKVVDSAKEHGVSTIEWADKNAGVFAGTFSDHKITNDDFVRTTEPRHKNQVQKYIEELKKSGDVYLGEYEGWYDAGQEEYVADSAAKDYNYISPINKKPLVRKKEKNYFFRLSAYQERLRGLLEGNEVDGQQFEVLPDARRNEVLGRIREGLNDVPISRTGMGDWGIPIPGDPEHTVYVWIDALFNYLSIVDTKDRIKYWPADVHLIAKDILWFHAVIWPAMLLALKRPLPKKVYAHSFWISDGQKMSKSLGNFVDLKKIKYYVTTYGLDALRWFLATQGPIDAVDSDFSETRFIQTYNSDLANALGNCFSRISNMTQKYFDGKIPDPKKGASIVNGQYPIYDVMMRLAKTLPRAEDIKNDKWLGIFIGESSSMDLIDHIDMAIEQTAPFRLAKNPEKMPEVITILYNCAEAMRLASILLWPFIPDKIEEMWNRMGLDYATFLRDKGCGNFDEWMKWGLLKPGTILRIGDPLFPRFDADGKPSVPKVK